MAAGGTCESLYTVPCVTGVLEEKASVVPGLNVQGRFEICEIRVHGRGLLVSQYAVNIIDSCSKNFWNSTHSSIESAIDM